MAKARKVKIKELAPGQLEKLSRDMLLSLNQEEMKIIQGYFSRLGREPTDIELETLAQT